MFAFVVKSIAFFILVTPLRRLDYSFVDLRGRVALPVVELLGLEPESDFVVSRFDGIRAVDNVSANINAEVSTDSAWC